MTVSVLLVDRIMRGMRNPTPQLTEREMEVLHQWAEGASNKQIARFLFVSEATVKSHLVHIFSKLGVDSRARAIRVTRDIGILADHA